MRRPLDLRLPRSRRWPLLALAVSVALHVVLMLVGAIDAWMPRLPKRPHAERTASADTVPLVFLEAPRPEPRPPSRRPAPPRRVTPEQGEDPFVAVAPEQLPIPTPPADTGAALRVREAPPPAIGRIGPGLGQGKLWVRPLPLPPRELARRLTRTQDELVDSTVTAVVQAFLDSVANDPSIRAAAMPDWTTRIGGKKFGLDSSSIYIAGLKIPAAVLALLPIPAGNVDQNRAYNHLMDLRADIQQAARRAATLAEFKERIREIRLRKEREDEFERQERGAPERVRDSAGADVVRQGQ